MYGVPSGVVFDPGGVTSTGDWAITAGLLLVPGDVALAGLATPSTTRRQGRVESLWAAPAAGQPARAVTTTVAVAGHGLAGDCHVAGTGTFPPGWRAAGLPGSALALVEAEVCQSFASFAPPLQANEHRRNNAGLGEQLLRCATLAGVAAFRAGC
jgi:hypothetical protein